MKSAKYLSLLILVVMGGLSLWARFTLPDVPMAVHFNVYGEADGFMSRDTALWVAPGLTAVITVLLLWVLPEMMPGKAPVKRSPEAYGAAIVGTLLLLAVVHAGIILMAMGIELDMLQIVCAGTGLLYILLGNYLPKVRHNYLMGIRTPWTLSDEGVWDRTHRISGPVFLLGGLATLVAAFILKPEHAFTVLMVGALVPAAFSILYSWLIWRGRQA